MRAVTIRSFGDPDGMEVVDLPSPEPAAGEVLIRTEAIGVGGLDAVIRRGAFGGGFSEGMVPGSEIAGVVTATGSDVDPSWVSQRVWAFTGTSGGYADEATARVEDVVALPGALSSIDAVTLGTAGPVAHFALARAHLAEGETVLVRGAAGSLGIAAVELATRAGAAAVAVTASSPGRGDRLRAYGATHVLDRTGHGVAPREFDVIIDIVAGPSMPSFIERLAPDGRMVVLGIVGGYPPADFGTALLNGFQRSLTVSTFSLDTVPQADLQHVRTELFAAASRGELHAVVHDVLDLAEAADAHRRMDAGEVLGRIVLTP
ncbi:zinc-binding dehydrogenase [Cellulomonas sp. P22]|uniref:zinc-binding dehydrogenase n=1 Tax=Cellulomonas sp. P22 TaxID=3373189 RepID=UPI00379D866E